MNGVVRAMGLLHQDVFRSVAMVHIEVENCHALGAINCFRVPGREGGFYIGPTVIDHVRPDMRIAQEEVFGPVLAIVRTRDLDEALAVENASPYGNAASIFTESGGLARRTMEQASAGMVGVNVGVPVPREPFPFGGWNESKFGVGDITGRGSIEFWTKAKKITTKWNREAGTNWMSK